ncbi:glycosyltransferase [Nonomuraea africana]|uniref:UDP:flavonoid glycosyltransferase YjiC (YdhE family) n=1 Tax=Nonomuraea africana TaxID=46171 RepID=A0ABR9KNW8_9ACTN|nr:glycosyltransferase [Nonomuraea africana]MBE1563717.1 UDP:flavonoid glycosyltransferase YjiC (YdhE family) [Nonomuraea africana]
MRVAILAFGSRGDTQPCVTLGEGVRARGHEVTVVAAERYAPLMGGLTLAPLSVDPVRIMESEEGQAWLRSGPLGFVRGFRRIVEPLAEKLVAEVDAAARDADLVLAPALGGMGGHLSDRYGMPHVILHFQPSHPTAEFPNPLVRLRTLGSWGNRASYALIERLSRLVLGRMVDRLRGTVLGLGPQRGHRDATPVLCGVSPLVVPRPRDWPGHIHLTGYWRPAPRPLPADLVAFVEEGPPPVYVGFGSMRPPASLAGRVLGALELAGVRAVVQGLPAEPSGTVFPVEEADHAALFPLMAAVVHHGGAGTTAAGLAAGVPNVVCPFFSDQHFWGARVAALGAGPEPLPVRRLTSEGLAARLARAVRNQRLAARLREEDGVRQAVDLLDLSG